jgi:Spy/CpxP family protein refolding chaperone
MHTARKYLFGAVVAAALAAGSVYAANGPVKGDGWRDCGPNAANSGPGAGHRMMHHGPGGGMFSNPMAMVEGHLAALKVELKITAAQEGAWKTFTDKARKQAEGMPARHEQMMAQMSDKDLPAPERLARGTELAKQHIASMESMTAAVKDLYAVLTPEQKKTADQLLARGPMGGMGHMGEGRGFRS